MNLCTVLYGLHGFMAAIGILHILRKIGPNHFVGIRIAKTLGNEKLWYEAHVFAGWSMLITSVLSIVLLAVVQLLHHYWNTAFPAELIGGVGATGLLLIGDGLVPLLYVLRIPDDRDPPSSQTVSETLGSDYAIMVYVFLTAILMLMVLPAAFERIEPNGSYGFRTMKTMSSDALWYASNRFSGWATIIAGCITIACLMVLRFGRPGRLTKNGYVYLLTYLVPTFASIVVSVWYVYWYL